MPRPFVRLRGTVSASSTPLAASSQEAAGGSSLPVRPAIAARSTSRTAPPRSNDDSSVPSGPTQRHASPLTLRPSWSAGSAGTSTRTVPSVATTVIVRPGSSARTTCQRTGGRDGQVRPMARVDQAASPSGAPRVEIRVGAPARTRIKSLSRQKARRTSSFERPTRRCSKLIVSMPADGSRISIQFRRRAMKGWSRSGRIGTRTAPESRRIMSSS